MKVLVVHDRESVGREIVSLLYGFSAGAITYCTDGSSAREKLGAEFFDLLILDLTLPNMAGRGEAGFQVAEALLEEIFVGSKLLAPANVLGITQDPSALTQIRNNIGPHLMAIIHEDLDGAWRQQLVDRVSYVRDSSAARTRSLLTKHDLDLLVLTALDKELTPYKEFFEVRDHPRHPGVGEFTFTDRRGEVRRGACYAIGKAGQPSAGSEAQGLICQLRPRLAVMSGFCGGVPKKANLGDILFAETAVDWDFGKWKPSASAARLYSRPEPISIRNSAAHRLARRIVEEGLADKDALNGGVSRLSKGEVVAPEIKLAPFASGSAVIAASNVLDGITDLNEAIAGVDMESFGFYFACKYPHAARPEFLCVKAVADDCGPTKDDRLHRACSFASAFVVKELITAMWEF